MYIGEVEKHIIPLFNQIPTAGSNRNKIKIFQIFQEIEVYSQVVLSVIGTDVFGDFFQL